MNSIDRQLIMSKGFRRGSIIDFASLCQVAELPEKVIEWVAGEEAVAIISLYDCAVVYDCLDKEPWLYVTIAKKIESQSGNYTFGKNERVIHFNLTNNMDGTVQSFESCAVGASIHLSRDILAEDKLVPIDELVVENLSDLITWVSERINRSTFEDDFNDQVKKKAYKVFEDKRMLDVTSVLIKIADTPKANGKTDVKVLLTCLPKKETIEYLQTHLRMRGDKTLAERMIDVFCICDAKKQEDCTCNYSPIVFVIAEEEVPVSYLRDYQKWSPEYFTSKKPDQAESSASQNKSFPTV